MCVCALSFKVPWIFCYLTFLCSNCSNFFFFFTSGKIKLFIGKTFLFLNLYACVYRCGNVHVLIQGESLTGCPMQNQVENQLTLKYMECKVSHLTFWQPTMGRKVRLLHILILEADLLYCFCQHPHVGEYVVTTLKKVWHIKWVWSLRWSAGFVVL